MEISQDNLARATGSPFQQNPINGVSNAHPVKHKSGSSETSPETSDPELEGWNPMAEDFSNLAFNGYREPSTEELRQWMPKEGKTGPSEDLMACYRSKDGDVRLFVNGIPDDVTGEGIKGLFNQVGKVTYCKVIPKKDPSRIHKFGFVGYNSYREAEHAIRKFDGFSLGNNMKLRVTLSKDKPVLQGRFPAMKSNFTATSSLEEKLENNDLDWGPPATPLDVTPRDGDPTTEQDEHRDSMVQEKVVDSKAISCNGEVQNNSVAHEGVRPTAEKTTAAVLEPLPCSKCGRAGRRRCGSCKAPYCSKKCQRLHWPEHKKFCNWKTDEEQEKYGIGSKVSPEEKTLSDNPPGSSHTDAEGVDDSKESDAQVCSKPDSNPSQEPYSIDDEDLEFSDVKQFAHLLGMRFVPKSPRESTSPQDPASKPRECTGSPLPSPEGSHYGYLKPLKKASPKPSLEELTPSVPSESELVKDAVKSEVTPSSLPYGDEVAIDLNASSTFSDTQRKEYPVSDNSKASKEPQQHYKRYYIDEVPHEDISLGGSYEIVGTSVSSPTLFWAQLYNSSALASQDYLFQAIKSEYENATYKTYVPSPKELCITQYSLDNNWYRSKVEYICNNGFIRVTHIDFGSSEDVDPSRIRRIKEDLVHIPMQAVKCALYLPEYSKFTEWSPETIEDFKSKVLDVKCRAVIKEVRDSVLYLDIYDSTGNTKINDILKEKTQKNDLQSQVPVYPESSQTSTENKPSKQENALPNNYSPSESESLGDTLEPPALDASERPLATTHNDASPYMLSGSDRAATQLPEISRKDDSSSVLHDYSADGETSRMSPTIIKDAPLWPFACLVNGAIDRGIPQGQESENVHYEKSSLKETLYKRPVSPISGEPDNKTSGINIDGGMPGLHCSSSESSLSSRSSSELDLQYKSFSASTPQRTGVVRGLPFKAAVTRAKSPSEFTVIFSDPESTAKLERLQYDLNMYCCNATYEAEKKYSFGNLCAVKLDEDNNWHRAKVLADLQQDGYKIYLVDIGDDRIVAPINIRSIPNQFKNLEPQSLLCSLAGVRKPSGSLVFGKAAIERFSSLVLYRNYMVKEISTFKQTHIVELLDETGQQSVASELINAGLADAYFKKVQRYQEGKEINPMLTFKIAINAANLPAQNAIFQMMATEIHSPGLFFVQLVNKETNQRLSELCAEMNKFYSDSKPHPDWQPRETELCAAFLKGTWFRAYLESVGQEAAKAYCVDFGNSEVISTSMIRPLAPTFRILPYCALRCSLGNIIPVESEEWPKEVTEFLKLKIPMSSTLNARLLYKGQMILFVDVFVSCGKSTESMIKLLVAKGLATYKNKKEIKSPSSTAWVSKDRMEEKSGPHKSFSPYSLSVYGFAIAVARLPNESETFEAVITEVMSSGELFVQIADETLAVQLIELTNGMNSYYSNASPTKFEAKQNLLCAAKFSTDWRRTYILEVNSDETAKVYDVDFGKTEVLPVSRLQLLQPRFTALQYFGLRCKLTLPRGINWSKDIHELFLSKIKFLVPITLKLCSRRIDILFVDVLMAEHGRSLSRLIISQTNERRRIQELDGAKGPNDQRYRDTHDTESFKLEKPMAAVTPPSEKQVFSAVVTEFQDPQCFYIHSDGEMTMKLTNLSADMNRHYNTAPRSPFQPVEGQLCAAPFGSPHDWYRGLVEKISTNKIAAVFYVDYGNTDEVPVANLRPLENCFASLPYAALHTSLAHVKPIDSSGWTRNAIDFVKSKITVGICFPFKIVAKGQRTLFVDLEDPNSGGGSLCDELVKREIASYSSVNSEKPPCRSRSSPRSKNTSPSPKESAITEIASCSPVNGEKPPCRSRSSPRSKNTSTSPKESAITSANLPPCKELFQVFATHVTSPGVFAVQIADHELARKVAALGKEMNAHYQSAIYPPFPLANNQLCAAQFTSNDEWYRGWIDGIISDDKVHVYYVDYGNSEDLDITRLRPLDKQFTVLPFSALACSIANVIPQDQGDWKQEAIDMFTSKVPLYQPINAKVIYKREDRLFLDIIDPDDSSTSISKALVEKGVAVWMQTKQTNEDTDGFQRRKQYDGSKKDTSSTPQETFPVAATKAVLGPSNNQFQEGQAQVTVGSVSLDKHLLDSIPMVSVPKGEFFNAMVCDVQKTGVVSLQVLSKELKELDELCTMIGLHCSEVDHCSYYPVTGELCLACFSQDKNWYRAVVNNILPNNQYTVTFVDFGNDDTLSSSEIRKIVVDFLRLPRQAYTGILAGGLARATTEGYMRDEILKAYKDKLLDKRMFARVNGRGCEIEFFSVGPDEKPDSNINIEILQKSTENNSQSTSVLTSVENQFNAVVSEVVGTGDIWVQRKDALVSLSSLNEDITSYCESSRSVTLTTAPSLGFVCLSKFSRDKKWYRAKVVENKSTSNVVVKFLDYGNNEEVCIDNLREAKPEFLQFPFQGVKCYLVGVVQGNPDADEYVQQTIDREMVVKVRERHAEALGIELEDHGVPNGPFNINENLIGFGYSA